MNRPNTQNLLEGSIARALWTLSGPIVFANILQTAYQLTDTFWVGRLGASAVAAVSVSFPLIFLVISLGGGLAIAGTVLVAQFKGKGDQQQVNYYASQTMSILMIIAVTISILGYLFTAEILGLINLDYDVYTQAVSYMEVTFIGFSFLFAFFAFQGLMRGVGDVITPLIIVLCTMLLNLVLDPLFILGWGPVPAFGVAGAAWATLGTQGIAGLVGIGLLFAGVTDIHLKPKYIIPEMAAISRIVKLGLPASIDQSIRALGLTVMTILVTAFGTLAVASYGIGIRILSFVIIPAVGFAQATSAIVGQNVGAGQDERAIKSARLAVGIIFGVLTVAGILIFAFAPLIITAFIPDDPSVIAEGSHFIRIVALTFGFIGVQQVIGGAFQGGGNTTASMILSLIVLWVLRFPLALVLSHVLGWGADGIWWAFPISNVVSAAIAVIWFTQGNWIRRVASRSPEPIPATGK